jgi:hypothetical protein
LDHGYGHALKGEESDRRFALLGFDVAIEATITGYLREGPGADDDGPLARAARAPGAKFWPKASWLIEHLKQAGIPFGHSLDDVNEIRSARNEVQHGGDWWVPGPDTIDEGLAIASEVVEALIGGEFASPFKQFHPVVHYMRMPTELELAAPPERRVLVRAAWDLARRIDPDGEGIHYAHLSERLLEEGFPLSGFTPARTLYDALNHAHDLFTRVRGARGVWRWTQAATRDPHQGISGSALADVCYVVAVELDPERRGLSYARDVLPALLDRGVVIRGVDIGATVNAALRRSPRFARIDGRPGFYRWQ